MTNKYFIIRYNTSGNEYITVLLEKTEEYQKFQIISNHIQTYGGYNRAGDICFVHKDAIHVKVKEELSEEFIEQLLLMLL